MIQALIFDYFGVIRPQHGVRQTFVDLGGDLERDKSFVLDTITAGNYGILDADAVLADRIGVPLQVWKKALAGQPYNDAHLLEFIGTLRAQYKIGLLSNATGNALQTFFAPGDIDKYFDLAMASGDIGIAKPQREAFMLMSTKIGVLPQNCIMIDDQLPNCEGAQMAGMQAIHYLDLPQLKVDLRAYIPAL